MSEMILWGGIFVVGIAVFGTAMFFLIRKVSKFGIFQKLGANKKWRSFWIAAIAVVVVLLLLGLLLRGLNAAIVILHVLLLWLIGDLINILLKKKFKEGHIFIGSVIVSSLYLLVGFYLCFTVVQKNYSFDTPKDVGSIRVVQFADSHLGTTFDGEGLNQYVDEINECHPDVVLITGDFVDDGTSREDMIAGCEALGRLETTYGVFYSFGNHDKGYSDASSRGFSGDDLVSELERNGVTVLEDEAVLIDNRFYVVGRQDRSEESRGGSRMSADELISGLDDTKYIIVMDHQPNDYDAESQTAADLVLSGHTHGGQMLPINGVGEWIGANDATYGLCNINGTDFIVTSGISDWEVYFKTGCRSEFVVIDIE